MHSLRCKLANELYSFTGTAYLGHWEPSAEAGFKGCASILAVSSLLALSFTSKSLMGIVTWLLDSKGASSSLPET